jgi:hypothetical protein
MGFKKGGVRMADLNVNDSDFTPNPLTAQTNQKEVASMEHKHHQTSNAALPLGIIGTVAGGAALIKEFTHGEFGGRREKRDDHHGRRHEEHFVSKYEVDLIQKNNHQGDELSYYKSKDYTQGAIERSNSKLEARLERLEDCLNGKVERVNDKVDKVDRHLSEAVIRLDGKVNLNAERAEAGLALNSERALAAIKETNGRIDGVKGWVECNFIKADKVLDYKHIRLPQPDVDTAFLAPDVAVKRDGDHPTRGEQLVKLIEEGLITVNIATVPPTTPA